ncbi:hypothetical protein QMN58_31780 [Escherichia coli]|nr:hypothetical protein [Escherichia coli]
MFKPYSNDDDVLNIQGDALTVSNGTARVVLNGTLELTRDQRGLKAALALKEAIDAVVAALQRPRRSLLSMPMPPSARAGPASVPACHSTPRARCRC